MKKLNSVFLLIVIACNVNVHAQCSTGVANYTSGSSSTPFAFSTVQTFQTSCGGILRNVVVPNIDAMSDDLRNTGYFVTARIKSASGTLLATGRTTDQWFFGNSLTFDLDCANLSIAANTTYQLEFLASTTTGTPQKLILFRRSITSIYSGGSYIEDGVAPSTYPDSDLFGWTVNLTNGNIAASTSSATQIIVPPCNAFYNAVPEIIASVQPNGVNAITGSTTTKLWLETSQPAQYVKRHYEITPVANASTSTGRLTLYFKQQEFTDFNAVNALKLPTGPSDAVGIANLLIEKRPGTSSNGTGLPGTYTGTATTINPADADIVWNNAVSRWEVTFDVTGFSGFFVKTAIGTLPVNWLNVSGILNSNKLAVLNFKVIETNVARYEIEKSNNGTAFTIVSIINSKGNGENSYQFTEATMLDGIKYYRIKQVDNDGRFSYSSIIKLSANANKAISIYPNPVKDMVTVTGATVGSKVYLIDGLGKVLQHIIVSQSSFTLNISNFSSGVYLLKTDDGVTQKIIKQ